MKRYVVGIIGLLVPFFAFAAVPQFAPHEVLTASKLNSAFAAVGTASSLSVTTPVKAGYGPGSGGSVVQTVNRDNAVTINKPTGQITRYSDPGSTDYQTFTVLNSLVEATDLVIVNFSGAPANIYQVFAVYVQTGSFDIMVQTPVGGGTVNESFVINFAIIKGSNN